VSHHDAPDRPFSRREWLFQESLCRTFCLLILIECLLEVVVGRKDGPCTGYRTIPLPCGRDLWEVESTPEWARRYREALRRRRNPTRVNVWDLISTEQRDGFHNVEGGGDGGMVEARLVDAAAWCQGVDQYGMLLPT
jgi:hypothetical protein